MPSAYYFYIFRNFIPYYHVNNNSDEWITVPYMYLDNKFYYYIQNNINCYQTKSINSSIFNNYECNQTNIQKVKDNIKINKEYVEYTRFFDDLIPLIWFNDPKPKKFEGGSINKIKYKSYYYKIRQDGYGYYIITQKDGRVSLNKVLKSMCH